MTLFLRYSYFGDYPDVDRKSCQLLGPTALVVQGLMGILVISSLVYKRHRESPKRPWRIWLFDVSKQVVGQMFVHGVNVLISDIVANIFSGNACVLYFLNILIDTTLGVAIIYFILHFSTYFLTKKCQFKGFESGQYGSPPSFNFWMRQAAVYVLALTSMKLLVIALFAIWPGIFQMGEWILSFLRSNEKAQVIFTMGIFPIIMNVVQFWLIDSIVKAGDQSPYIALPTEAPRTSSDQDPLFHASSDDEDEDQSQRHDEENPSSRSRSLSRLGDHTPNTQDELKSSAQPSPMPSGSGGSTLEPTDVAGAQSIPMHVYPPVGSASTSPLSSCSSHSRVSSVSPNPSKRRRRSPPPPLTISRAGRPAVNIVQNPDPVLQHKAVVKALIQDEKDWVSWNDEFTDDWASRVGEEEWTGKRVGSKRDALHDIWVQHGMALRTGSR